MNLHMFNTEDGYALWGAFLTGTHNDGDGGIHIYEWWFTIARTEEEARKTLEGPAEARKARFSWHAHDPGTIEYRTIGPSELVVCWRLPVGDHYLKPVKLTHPSASGLNVTAALIDMRS